MRSASACTLLAPARFWGGQGMLSLAGVSFFIAFCRPSFGEEVDQSPAPTESAQEGSESEDTSFEIAVLPVGSLFSPLIADMKEPQFSLAYRHVRFRDKGLPAGREDSEISAGLVALGLPWASGD